MNFDNIDWTWPSIFMIVVLYTIILVVICLPLLRPQTSETYATFNGKPIDQLTPEERAMYLRVKDDMEKLFDKSFKDFDSYFKPPWTKP